MKSRDWRRAVAGVMTLSLAGWGAELGCGADAPNVTTLDGSPPAAESHDATTALPDAPVDAPADARLPGRDGGAPREAAAPYDAGAPDAASVCTGCKVKQLALGMSHSCALMDTGVVACWGDNAYGQLGDGRGGGTPCRPVQTCGNRVSSWPVRVSGLTDAVALGAGALGTCAIRATGEVVCWGVTNMATNPSFEVTPKTVPSLTDAVQVAGGFHTCAVRSNGKVRCWGANVYGKTGMPDTNADVSGIDGAKQVVGGRDHSCARLGDADAGGEVRCWGYNSHGGLGNGVGGAGGPTPVLVDGVPDARHLSATAAYGDGEALTCAVRASGEVACWGKGGCALGAAANSAALVPLVHGAVEVAALRRGACARLTSGEIVCWGPSFTACPAVQPMAGLAGITHLASSAGHVCALDGTGKVFCWGDDTYSQLGDGAFTSAGTPVQVQGLPF